MIYLTYILSFGSFFLIKYLRSEKEIKSRKELSLLVFFPMVGYGNWLYNKEKRASGTTTLPRSWYIWRKMVFQNFLMILLSSILTGFLILFSVYENIYEAVQFASGTVTVLENNIDPTLGMGLFIVVIIGITFLLTLLFFLVLLPALIAKIIRFNYEKNT